MGTRLKENGVERVYAAADAWVDRALRKDDSLFTPGKPIWSSQWLGELHQRFLNSTGNSGTSFVERLQPQLDDSPPEVSQLVSEALYFHFLIAATKTSDYKNGMIKALLPKGVEIRQDLVAALTPGILDPGMYFKTHPEFPVWFLIEFVEQWKKLGQDERDRLLGNTWDFKDFVSGLNFRSELLRRHYKSALIQQRTLLHLAFPDTFEAIASIDHKEKIAKTFARFIKNPMDDVDRQLEQIRAALEPQYGSRDHFFYKDEIRIQWNPKSDSPPPPPPPPQPIDPWAPENIAALAERLLWEPEHLREIIEDLRGKGQLISTVRPGPGRPTWRKPSPSNANSTAGALK